MTASVDATLKHWSIAKTGMAKKYIGSFDRTEGTVSSITAGDETALTIGTSALR